MKRRILTIVFLSGLSTGIGQLSNESVNIGAGYANHGFYSLENGDLGQVPKNAWDLSFETSGFGAGVRINGANQVQLWKYPHADNSSFGTPLDTTGLSTWNSLINSDTAWSEGAFNATTNPGNQFDLGWGTYNTVTHSVMGDSLFIISTGNGDFIQFDMMQLMSGEFRFRYAQLDGSQIIQDTIRKSDYAGKNFGYYHFASQSALDLEPVASSEWDLMFTQYVTYVAPNVPMGVAGVLANNGVEIAKIAQHPDAQNYQQWFGKTYSTKINAIGYDWKQLNYSTFQFEIEDSLLFFIKANTGDIWKVIFTGFGGSATGNYEFSKEKLSTANLESFNQEKASMSVYPNPSSGSNIHIVYDIPAVHSDFRLQIVDLAGRIHHRESLQNSGSLTHHSIAHANLLSGIYFVQLEFSGNQLTQKLIIE